MNLHEPMLPTVGHIARLALNVRDLDRAVGFYVDALGFSLTRLTEESAHLRLGAEHLELVRRPDGNAYPTPRRANDPWFQHFAIAVADMDVAYARLRRHAPEPITRGGPQVLPPSTGSVTAYKFRDPDGHPLELSFVPGSDWSRRTMPSGGASLGIDHTALAVRDLATSIAFYTRLGFRLDARFLNRGSEQGRLDGLDDPVVEIVTLLTPEAGPHVELLHYRSPAPAPTVQVSPGDIAATVAVLKPSLDRTALPAALTDPDGHLLQALGSQRRGKS